MENDANDILMVKHAYGDKKWCVPGGGIGLGEIASKAVVREDYEETGYVTTAAIMTLAAVLTPQLHYGLVLLFHCERKAEALSHEPGIVNKGEIADVRFMSEMEINELGDAVYPAQHRLVLQHFKAYKETGKIVIAQL